MCIGFCRSVCGQCLVFVNKVMKLCVFLKGGEFLNQTRDHEIACPMISDSKQRVCAFIHRPMNFRTRKLEKKCSWVMSLVPLCISYQ